MNPNPPRQPGSQGPGDGMFKNSFVWLMILVAVVAIFLNAFPQSAATKTPQLQEVDMQTVANWAKAGQVRRISVGEDIITIEPEMGPNVIARKDTRTTMTEVVAMLRDLGVTPEQLNKVKTIETAKTTDWNNIITIVGSILPVIIIGGFLLFMLRQAQGANNQALSFGKSRAKMFANNKTPVTFADVAGVEEAKQELQEVVEFLKQPDKFTALGARIPRGVLLVGPPGVGKTLLARAVAGEAGVPFFSISGSEFVEMFVGVGASVTGDTPILIRTPSGVRLLSIAEFVDTCYQGDTEGFVVPVANVQTLGFEEKKSKFKGSPKRFFGRSDWKNVAAVYRHRVNEIYEIRYLGGVMRTTGDHSLFVRTRNGVQPVAARDLKPGDVLVNLPGGWSPVVEGSNPSAEIVVSAQDNKCIVQETVVKPYDGFVYDLCGCENEAFFGGEKPILLHNSRVRDLFDQAKKNAPCIVFVDELDAVGRHRGAGLGGSHDEREQTLNQILVEMDGFDTHTNIIIVAATNRPDILDPALLRPGRFDRQVVLDRPDINGRKAILDVHMKGKTLAPDVKVESVARQTPGFSGADLANLVNEAAILAARRNKKAIEMPDLQEAVERVIAGPERKSRVISDSEKKIIAYHEAGHAVVFRYLPNADRVHKVSIISRGMSLGYTMPLPEEDRHIFSKAKFMSDLAGLMGGRAAEALVIGDITTGAGNDIERATELARKMVCEWGMSEKMGPLSYGKKEEMIFLGREMAQHADYSEQTALEIDAEVKSVVMDAHGRAKKILQDNVAKLHTLAEALLDKEVLDGEQIEKILSA